LREKIRNCVTMRSRRFALSGVVSGEREMLRIRIVMAAAIAALVLASGSVAAQTGDQPGQPLKLLAGLRPPHEKKMHESKASVHAKTAHKTTHKTAAKLAARVRGAGKTHGKVAAAQSNPVPTETAPVAPPVNAWPAADTPATVSAPEPAPADSPPPQQGTVTFEGQKVQLESPNRLNALDLAAGDSNDATARAQNDNAGAAPAAPIALAAPMHQDAGQNADTVGGASWIAQVLAAFGGAVAAGAVAWFLIGSGPVRIYG
jgi:hypothetical protein